MSLCSESFKYCLANSKQAVASSQLLYHKDLIISFKGFWSYKEGQPTPRRLLVTPDFFHSIFIEANVLLRRLKTCPDPGLTTKCCCTETSLDFVLMSSELWDLYTSVHTVKYATADRLRQADADVQYSYTVTYNVSTIRWPSPTFTETFRNAPPLSADELINIMTFKKSHQHKQTLDFPVQFLFQSAVPVPGCTHWPTQHCNYINCAVSLKGNATKLWRLDSLQLKFLTINIKNVENTEK